MKPSHAVAFIDTSEHLREFCDSLRDATWLAVDTEFLRERTYFPRFCLLQVASSQLAACIDPLRIEDLSPIQELLFDPGITKVLHSGRQDLEIFHHLWRRLPSPIFDTQIAAPLIGLAEQISYAGLVQEILGVNLGKGQTRTDWSLRPLSEAQIRYAAEDVIYLAAAYQALLGRLEALDRMHWLDEDFAALLNPKLYENLPEEAWNRIGGAQQLRGRALATLQGLAGWRERTARELDIPRGWVVRDDAMVDLARLAPTCLEELKRIRGIEERSLRRHGDALCQVIVESRERAPIAVESTARAPRKSPDQEALMDLLSAVVRLRAAQHSLNPGILANRKDLEQWLDQPEQSRVFKGWRKTMVGEELAALMQGQCHITVVDGRLHVMPRA